MNYVDLLYSGAVIVGGTFVLLISMGLVISLQKRKFNNKAAKIGLGVYSSRFNGDLVTVKGVNGDSVYVVDGGGGFHIPVEVFIAFYDKVSE
jgi:hypothetical protein